MLTDNCEPNKVNQYPYHRRFVRHKVRLRVQVRIGEHYQSWTLNISEDGLCFEIPVTVKVGKELDLWIFVHKAKGDKPIQSRCQVVWNQPGKKGFRHGGQFVSFEGDGLLRLREFLTNQ